MLSSLLVQLNVAAGDLAQAENSYQAGESTAAGAQADSVLPITQQVTVSAQHAEQTALVSGQNAFWSTISFTVIGSFVFVLILFLIWRRFKGGYMEKLLGSKPEVAENKA